MALALYQVEGLWVLPLICAAGALGGMAWAAIPAFLRTRFNTNEILVSLMLVYVATLLLSSVLQGVALLLYVFFDGLFSLYVISALFGLFQGSIVPMYAIIVREYFAPQEAGTRLGFVLLATLGGMALGGWMSGLIFDLTGSYQAAFLNGLAWNLVNVSIVTWLLFRPSRRGLVPA